jgi:hypothetical protein
MSAGRNINTKSKSWGTPKKYVDAVKLVFDGNIDLDPCSNEYSIVNATIEYLLPNNDGLKENWTYNKIFVNPPYGIDKERKTSIKNWIEKCYKTNLLYNNEIIALIPVATNTKHWKEFIFKKANLVCFLNDTRLRFLENGLDVGKGAPMACAMIYWGNNNENFIKVFKDFGNIVNVNN